MAARKPDMEKIHTCTGTCGRLTRPSRMLPLASLQTYPRTKGGLCQRCYSAERRLRDAAEREANAKVAKRPITKRPEVLEAEQTRHAAAGLDRFLAQREARLARRRVSA
jgi:hypothetical protein